MPSGPKISWGGKKEAGDQRRLDKLWGSADGHSGQRVELMSVTQSNADLDVRPTLAQRRAQMQGIGSKPNVKLIGIFWHCSIQKLE